MKNHVQPGRVLEVSAPSGGIASGDGLLVGSLFGVAAHDADEGAAVNIALEGVFALPKASAQAWTQGAKVYWDNTAKECTTTATGNALIGAAAADAANPSPTGRVRLSN